MGKDGAKSMPCFLPLCLHKDGCVQVGMVLIPLPRVPSCQDSMPSDRQLAGLEVLHLKVMWH